MNNQRGSTLTTLALVAVIIIAIFFVIRAILPKKAAAEMVDWTCEGHGYKFVAPKELGPIKCPKHGDEAVRTVYYECDVHDHVFEAYRMKPAGKVKKGDTYTMLYKVPGSQWVGRSPRIVCPHGNNDLKTLKYVPPKR